MNRPRVLIVGACGYGGLYVNEMTGNDTGADLVGVCDINPDVKRIHPVLEERQIPVYRDLDEFYAHDTADLCIIVTPVHYHAELALQCLAHGTNVLCEKPLCLTIEEAHRMTDAAKAAGRFVAVGYQLDYRRDVLALKRDILGGTFGAPLRLSAYQCFRRGAKYYARNNWAGRIRVDGREVLDSPFANASAHNFQMMTFLLGDSMNTSCDVLDVQAELYHGNPAVENYDIAAMRFQTTSGAQILYYTAHPLQTALLGPAGVFEFEKGTITFDSEEPSFRATLRSGETIDYTAIDPGPHMQKLYDVIDCIKNGGEPVCGIAADTGHINAVRMLQQQPIHQVRDELRYHIELDGDTFLCIRGLEDTIINSARAWALPSEIGCGLG